MRPPLLPPRSSLRGIAAARFDGALSPTLARLIGIGPRRRSRKPGAEGEGMPVDPRRPLNLSGGAAASLEFDT